MDNIAFYSDKEIKAWYNEFVAAPPDIIIISSIPFSYYEIRDEILRRDRIKGVEEDLKALRGD